MRWLWVADRSAVGQTAAELVGLRLRLRPESVLGLPTGESAVPMYDRLSDLCRAGLVSFARATTFNLDEYVGLPPGDPASYRAYMEERFVRRVDIAPARVHLPRADGAAGPDPGDAYEAAIRACGGWDAAVLGVGPNGHIAFNEPGSAAASRTRVVDLAPATRQANALGSLAGRPVPTRAVTVGIGTILEAGSILLLASGAGKAQALAALAKGVVDPAWPATHLLGHPDVTVIAETSLRVTA